MHFSDFIGFIITILAFLFLFFQKRLKQRQAIENQEILDEAEGRLYESDDLQNPLGMAKEEPFDQPVFKSNLKLRKPRITALRVPSKQYEDTQHKPLRPPQIVSVFKRLKYPRDMAIYSEIMNKPKGLF